jgi:hypothetical protein
LLSTPYLYKLFGGLPKGSFQNNSTCLQQFISLGIFPNVSGLCRRILMIEKWKVFKSESVNSSSRFLHQNKIILMARANSIGKSPSYNILIVQFLSKVFHILSCTTINYPLQGIDLHIQHLYSDNTNKATWWTQV